MELTQTGGFAFLTMWDQNSCAIKSESKLIPLSNSAHSEFIPISETPKQFEECPSSIQDTQFPVDNSGTPPAQNSNYFGTTPPYPPSHSSWFGKLIFHRQIFKQFKY